MPAGKLDLLIEKGATFRKSLVWKQGDVAVDLTGYTARMQIRSPHGAVVLELTTENGRIVLQSPGQIDLYITAVDTTSLVGFTAKYDLEMVCGEEVTRLVQGTVTLSAEITKELP